MTQGRKENDICPSNPSVPETQAGQWSQTGFDPESEVEEDPSAADVFDNDASESSPVALQGLQTCRMVALVG